VYGYPNLGPLPSGVTPAYEYDKQAYMSITPNPVGLGQEVLVNVWTTPGQPDYFYMYGYKVTIQKPDGTTEVIGPFNSYIGDDSAWFNYIVDQVGTWKWKFEDPGTYVPAGTYVVGPGAIPPTNRNYTLGASMYYKPSATDWQDLTVQADMVFFLAVGSTSSGLLEATSFNREPRVVADSGKLPLEWCILLS